MKAAEVWQFPMPSGEPCALRVVLALRDLGPAMSPMAFVNDCFLVQIGYPGESFDATRVLVNGMFLSFRPREAKRAGFLRVGALGMSASEIEFPCWLARDTKRGVLFCRGEIAREVGAPNAIELYERWDIRLSPITSEQLIDDVDDFVQSRGVSREGTVKRVLGVSGSDIRYHPERELILAELEMAVSRSYLTDLEEYAPGRSEAYQRAIAP